MDITEALNQALPSILAAMRPILDEHNLTHVMVSKLEFAKATERDSSTNKEKAHNDGAAVSDSIIISSVNDAGLVCRPLLDSNGQPMRDSRGRIITVCS